MSLTRRQHAILRYLEAHPGATKREIVSALQYTVSQLESSLVTLYSRGLVGRQNALGLDDSLHAIQGAPWRYYSARTVADVGS